MFTDEDLIEIRLPYFGEDANIFISQWKGQEKVFYIQRKL